MRDIPFQMQRIAPYSCGTACLWSNTNRQLVNGIHPFLEVWALNKDISKCKVTVIWKPKADDIVLVDRCSRSCIEKNQIWRSDDQKRVFSNSEECISLDQISSLLDRFYSFWKKWRNSWKYQKIFSTLPQFLCSPLTVKFN